MTASLLAELILLDCLLILMTNSVKTKFCRTFVVFLITLQSSQADTRNADTKSGFSKSAILEVRQQTSGNDGKEIVALLLNGRFSGAGVTEEASGTLIKLPDEECNENYEDFVRRLASGWIGVLTLGSPHSSSASSSQLDSETNQNSSDCHTVLEKVNKAMLFGASAIIILVLNPRILQELDVGQILSKPLVFVEDSENVSVLLNALKSKMKLKMRITYGSTSLYDTQTFTVWSACWRARPGSGVVCRADHKLSKADPSLFWSYFYSAIAVVILLLMLKTNHRDETSDVYEDNQTVHTIARIALSLLKTKRYRNRTCWPNDDRDSCAICLDNFYHRQVLRVLPCQHEFHCKCVDRWLISRQTCPLCKSNIVEYQINEGLIGQRLSSQFS